MADALPPPRTPNNKWHGSAPDPSYKPPKSKRGLQLYWLSALLLGLLGTVAAIVFYPNTMTRPRFLSMTVREYRSPLMAPNAFARQDGELLAQHFQKKDTEYFYDSQSRNTFEKFLDRLENLGDGPAVVQLGALGRVDKDRVVLYLVDADLNQPGRGMPLKDVLNRMKKGMGSGDRLLLLDLARPVADVQLGILADELAAAVHRELELMELPFFVLTACSAGQLSHVSEELGASVFAYHLDLGMRGFAEKTPDRRINVLELADFTRKHVDRWVWFNRGQRQEPRLYGKAKDFPIALLSSDPPEMPEAPAEKTYAPWLKAGWQERDKLYQDGSYRHAPWAFRKLELALARTEKRWRMGDDTDVGGGKGATRLSDELAGAVKSFKDEILKSRDPGISRTFSVAEIGDAKIDSLAKSYQNRFDRYLNKVFEPGVKLDKLDEADKARLAEVMQSKTQLLDELSKLPFDSAAAIVASSAVRPPNLTPGRIVALVELLAALRAKLPVDRRLSEVVYLERLKELSERVMEIAEWQGSIAHVALRIEFQAAEVLAELGRTPSGFDPWNKSLLVQAEAQRRLGHKDLFAGIDFSWREAQAAYMQAEPAYRAIPRRLEILRSMQEHRDQAFIHLPGWGPYLIAQARVDRQELDTWQEGLPAARDLADALERKDPNSLDSEPTSLSQWQIFASRWQKLIDVRIQQLKRHIDDCQAPEYYEWHALLESSRHSAVEREMLWANARALGLKLISKTPRPDAAEGDLIHPGADPTARQEQDRAKRRVKQTLGFLELAAYSGKIDNIEAAPLQDSLIRGVPAEFLGLIRSKDALPSRLFKADRLGRVFPENVLRQLTGAEMAPGFLNPARKLYRLEQEAYWDFLRTRYQGDADNLKAQKGRNDHELFFRDAETAYPELKP